MPIWELRNAGINDFATLVLPDADERLDLDKVFGGSGAPLKWRKPQVLEVFVERRRKKPKPRADVSTFAPGALVLNERARGVLADFLGRFGQLLALDVEGTREYFYNVTNVVRCIDLARSRTRPEGTVAEEVFDEAALPTEPAVFKDPATAPVRIYANDGAKAILIAQAGLTGLELGRVGR